MNIKLAENIKTMRRERKMTQEQLAEALGVTVGAVYKWESKASMPEIRLLLEIADLFEVSVDSLLGYEMQSSAIDDIVERIKAYMCSKDFDSAVSECEKALLKYPNTFKVVFCCAETYERRGIETTDTKFLMKAIELMEHSILLLSQNDDPEVSEITIRSDIATCYIKLGQMGKSIEILKKYNAGGINNSLIGLACSISEEYSEDEAAPFLTKAFANSVIALVRCMSGYMNYYSRKEDFASALDAALWAIRFFESVKTDADEVCYLDKITSVAYAACACFSYKLGQAEQSRFYLSTAQKIARKFDASPVYNAHAIKFCISDIEYATASDDIGVTAMDGIERLTVTDDWGEELKNLWEELKSEI